jgi:hypothetical protein
MDNEEYAALSVNARAYAEEWLDAPTSKKRREKCLNTAFDQPGCRSDLNQIASRSGLKARNIDSKYAKGLP